MVPDALTDLPDTIRRRFKDRPVKVVISSGEDREPVWESIARRVLPAVVTSMATAMATRVIRSRSGQSAEA